MTLHRRGILAGLVVSACAVVIAGISFYCLPGEKSKDKPVVSVPAGSARDTRTAVTTAQGIGKRTENDLLRLMQEKDLAGISRSVSGLSADGIAAILDDAAKVMEKSGWQARRALFAACAKRNPAQTASWAMARLLHCGDRMFALSIATAEWIKSDAGAALAWAKALADISDRDTALRVFFDSYAGADPESAAKLMETTDFSAKDLVMGTLGYAWASTNLNAAVAWAESLPQGTGRTQALTGIVKWLQVSGKIPPLSGKSTAEENRADMIRKLLALMPADRRDGAAERLSKLPGGAGIDPVFQLQISRWALQSTNEVCVWARQWAGYPHSDDALAVVAEALSAYSPGSAAFLVEQMTPGDKRTRTAKNVAATWAIKDPVQAIAWQQTATKTSQSDSLPEAPSVPAVNTPSQPAPAVEVEPATEETVVVPADVFSWSWPELIPLVEKLPDGKLRDGLVYRVGVDWARNPGWDPSAAAAWCMQQLSEGKTLDMVLRVIVWDWTNRDKNSAVAWASGLEDTARRDQAVATVSLALARTDPPSATGLVVSISDEARRNTAVGNLAYRWALTDRGAATTWAQSLTNSSLRNMALQKIQDAEIRGD